MRIPKHLQAELALLSLTITWGVSFPVIKIVLGNMPPGLFLSCRFTLAFLSTIPFILKTPKSEFRNTIQPGLVLGLFLGLGFLLQTIGLIYTTSTKNAFITSLYIVFVPLIYILMYRKIPGRAASLGTVISLTGLYLLTSPSEGSVNIGDILTLFTAVSYALYIIYVDIYSRRHALAPLVFWQLAWTVPLSGFYTFFFESHTATFTPLAVMTIIVMALLGTTIPAFVQTGLQKNTTPSRTAVIFSGEAVFAAIASYLILSEMLSLTGWIGAILILCGILFCELGKPRSPSRD
jgi:drug/metabolite transporter (DMT)-like permease